MRERPPAAQRPPTPATGYGMASQHLDERLHAVGGRKLRIGRIRCRPLRLNAMSPPSHPNGGDVAAPDSADVGLVCHIFGSATSSTVLLPFKPPEAMRICVEYKNCVFFWGTIDAPSAYKRFLRVSSKTDVECR